MAVPLAVADFKAGTYELGGQPSTLAELWTEDAGFSFSQVVPGVGLLAATANDFIFIEAFVSPALLALLANGTTGVIQYITHYDQQPSVGFETFDEPATQYNLIEFYYGVPDFPPFSSIFVENYGGTPASESVYDYDTVTDPGPDMLHRFAVTILDAKIDTSFDGQPTATLLLTGMLGNGQLPGQLRLTVSASNATGPAETVVEKVTFYPPQPPADLPALTAEPPPVLVEPLTLETVKDYLRVLDAAEDDKIAAMIPRARLWVEEHTGLALIQRQFTELHCANNGVVRLYRGPLVEVIGANYTDPDGAAQIFAPVATPPSTKLTGTWPANNGQPFAVSYVAGLPPGQEDARLLGAMLALIEGEYSAGFAYPPETITAAVNATFYLKFVAP